MADLTITTTRAGIKVVDENSSTIINEYSLKRSDLNKDSLSIISDIKNNFSNYEVDFNKYDNVYLNNVLINSASELETALSIVAQIVDVYLQDQHTEIIDLHVSRQIQEISIASNTALNDRTITITSSLEPTNGNIICLKEATAFYQGEILSHSANGDDWDITLDTPLDYAYTTSGGCSERSIDLNVNGSVTPIEFTVSPADLAFNTKWDITRMLITINDATAMDDGKFGGVNALTNGIVIRVENSYTKNIFNAKTNGDLASHMYDVQYIDATLGPGGQYALRGRRSFSGQDKNGVVIRLNANTDDAFKVVVQDDLTGLTKFHIIIQGHIVE